MHRFLATAGLLGLGLVPSVSWAETINLTLRNGDSLQGELIERNPENGTTVLNHPQLGRLELTADQLKPATTKPPWTSSVSAGVIGNEKDGDNSLSVSFTGKTRYKDDQQKLSLSGSFNASKSKDSGEALSIDTEKGSAELRYDKPFGNNLDWFALSNYQYNGTNDSGVNTVLGNVGVAFPIIKSNTTDFTVSIGPSMQWSGGGVTLCQRQVLRQHLRQCNADRRPGLETMAHTTFRASKPVHSTDGNQCSTRQYRDCRGPLLPR